MPPRMHAGIESATMSISSSPVAQAAFCASMQADVPKQYLKLRGMPVACHSLVTFAQMPEVKEIVVVCENEWRCAYMVESLDAHAAS